MSVAFLFLCFQSKIMIFSMNHFLICLSVCSTIENQYAAFFQYFFGKIECMFEMCFILHISFLDCQRSWYVIDPVLIPKVICFFPGAPSLEYPRAPNSGLVPSKYVDEKSMNCSFETRLFFTKNFWWRSKMNSNLSPSRSIVL